MIPVRFLKLFMIRQAGTPWQHNATSSLRRNPGTLVTSWPHFGGGDILRRRRGFWRLWRTVVRRAVFAIGTKATFEASFLGLSVPLQKAVPTREGTTPEHGRESSSKPRKRGKSGCATGWD